MVQLLLLRIRMVVFLVREMHRFQKGEKMNFTLNHGRRWGQPDIQAYEAAKGVNMIHAPFDPLPAMNGLLPGQFPGVEIQIWQQFWGPRIQAAMAGETDVRFPTLFPGCVLPGPGPGQTEVFAGALQLMRFAQVVTLRGGFPDLQWRAAVEPQQKDIPTLPSWQWQQVVEPRLAVLHFARSDAQKDQMQIETMLDLLHTVIANFIKENKIPDSMELIHRLWSAHTPLPEWRDDQLATAAEILGATLSAGHNVLAVAFELEALLTRSAVAWFTPVGWGMFGGSWLEVGFLPISQIRATELVVPHRLLDELVSIYARGFAPIVINEWGCDTDGTHRLAAAWLWNLLTTVPGAEIHQDSAVLQRAVEAFAQAHREDMGELLLREVLRCLQLFLTDETYFARLKAKVIPELRRGKVRELPVMLLPEYSWGTVIKGSYDDGDGAFRVCPSVYWTLRQNSALTLPARGPYHRTDRAVAPWCEVMFHH